MVNQQDQTLGRQLERHLDDIIKDFNQVLEKYGFPKTRVVNFAVKQLNSLSAPSSHHNLSTEASPDASDNLDDSITKCDANGHCQP
ncbi:hypothetical protein [Nostoc sp. JL33]|uniref:hypothetical protein n=1 Tax=Nostoc sp. JL33 TaxID=2815396 RepID=UPI0025FD6105|nr:hypothetical protein [Nostoc sp. JL33]MBN3871635.1 hypothetical protein [Nostoc sp. JL33]